MKQMSRRERIQAAITRQPVDRVPYAVWRHFPAVDRSPAGLAQATLRFHDHYGSDFLKITPHGGYAVEAWGCVEAEEVLPDGHRACASCAVKTADDWKKIRALDPTSAEGYSHQIETIVRMGFDHERGWVDFKWPNPVTKRIENKSAYVIRTNEVVCGVGYYKQ